jgi:hypothetical protein
LSDDAPKLSDVTWTRFVINITQALSDRMLKWAALLMAFVVTGAIMWRPNPIRAAVACLFVALLSPLWLRKDRGD